MRQRLLMSTRRAYHATAIRQCMVCAVRQTSSGVKAVDKHKTQPLLVTRDTSSNHVTTDRFLHQIYFASPCEKWSNVCSEMVANSKQRYYSSRLDRNEKKCSDNFAWVFIWVLARRQNCKVRRRMHLAATRIIQLHRSGCAWRTSCRKHVEIMPDLLS
jgi:hypothetical protein